MHARKGLWYVVILLTFRMASQSPVVAPRTRSYILAYTIYMSGGIGVYVGGEHKERKMDVCNDI